MKYVQLVERHEEEVNKFVDKQTKKFEREAERLFKIVKQSVPLSEIAMVNGHFVFVGADFGWLENSTGDVEAHPTSTRMHSWCDTDFSLSAPFIPAGITRKSTNAIRDLGKLMHYVFNSRRFTLGYIGVGANND